MRAEQQVTPADGHEPHKFNPQSSLPPRGRETLDLKIEMNTNRIRFHSWFAPLVWLPIAILSALYPGDKYLSFYFATIPGAWVQEIFNVGFGLFATIIQIVAALLAVIALGMLMDFVQVKRNIYFYFVIICCAAGLFAANHKIKLDDLFLLLCWAIYLTGIIAVLISLIRRATRWSNQALWPTVTLAFLPFAFRVEFEGNHANTGRQARLRLNATLEVHEYEQTAQGSDQ